VPVTPRLGGPSGLLAVGCAAVVALAVTAALGLTRSYEPRALSSGSAEFRRVAPAVSRSAIVVALGGLAMQADRLVRPWVFAVLPAYAVAALTGRLALRLGLHRRRRHSHCMLPVLAVGGSDAVQGAAAMLERTRRHPQYGWVVTGVCTPTGRGRDCDRVMEVPVLGDLDAVPALGRSGAFDVVSVGFAPGWTPHRLQELARHLEHGHAELAVDPGLMEALDGGPVFFRQRRIDVGGREFRMVEFRSVVVDAEARLAGLRERNEGFGGAATCHGRRACASTCATWRTGPSPSTPRSSSGPCTPWSAATVPTE
jgi:FlaA1/EpsC-like NDP-sugar epimerase